MENEYLQEEILMLWKREDRRKHREERGKNGKTVTYRLDNYLSKEFEYGSFNVIMPSTRIFSKGEVILIKSLQEEMVSFANVLI